MARFNIDSGAIWPIKLSVASRTKTALSNQSARCTLACRQSRVSITFNCKDKRLCVHFLEQTSWAVKSSEGDPLRPSANADLSYGFNLGERDIVVCTIGDRGYGSLRAHSVVHITSTFRQSVHPRCFGYLSFYKLTPSNLKWEALNET